MGPLKSSSTLLPLLATVVQGAVVRHCTGFEGQLGEFTPSLKVQTEYPSTVLISYLNDLDQHLMVDLDLDVTMSVADYWYPLYNDNNTFDESVVLVKKPKFEVINTELQAGESIVYNATLAGVYCAVINQHNTSEVDLEGLHITTTHIYGDYKLTGYNWLKLLLLIIPVAVFHHVLIPWLFPNIHQYHLEEDVWCVLKYAVIGKFGATSGKVFFWSVLYMCGIRRSTWENLRSLYFLNFWSVLNHFLSLIVIATLYKVAIVMFSFKKGEVEEAPQKHYDGLPSGFRTFIILSMYLVELGFAPMALPVVSKQPSGFFTLIFYSIVCDWEGALYAMGIAFANVECRIGKDLIHKDWPIYTWSARLTPANMEKRFWSFICTSLFAYIMMGFWGILSRYVLVIGHDAPTISTFQDVYDLYELNDPSTSYNYVIMWNVVCNWAVALPGMLIDKFKLSQESMNLR